MNPLARQTCVNHLEREAAARCPECGQYYCRECVTEHDGRVICAACLKQLAQSGKTGHPAMGRLRRIGGALLGMALAWVFFYWTGQALLRIPANYHDGSVWEESVFFNSSY
jgi:uncharacterized protein (DUF983 family)